MHVKTAENTKILLHSVLKNKLPNDFLKPQLLSLYCQSMDPVTHPVFAYATSEVQIQSDAKNNHRPQLAL